MVVHNRTYTVDEYRAVHDLPQNRDKILELIDGEIVEKVPGFTPSRIGYNIGFHVKLYLRDNPIGCRDRGSRRLYHVGHRHL